MVCGNVKTVNIHQTRSKKFCLFMLITNAMFMSVSRFYILYGNVFIKKIINCWKKNEIKDENF